MLAYWHWHNPLQEIIVLSWQIHFFYQEFIVFELSQIIVKNYAVNITVLFKIKKALTECDKGKQQPDLVNLEAYLRESAKLKTTIAR